MFPAFLDSALFRVLMTAIIPFSASSYSDCLCFLTVSISPLSQHSIITFTTLKDLDNEKNRKVQENGGTFMMVMAWRWHLTRTEFPLTYCACQDTWS